MSAVILYNINVDNYKRQLKDEAQRIAVTFRLAADESIFLSKELGVQVFEDGYRFVVWQDNDTGNSQNNSAADKAAAEAEENAGEGEAFEAVTEQTDETQDTGSYTGNWEILTSESAFDSHRFEKSFRIYLEVEDSEIELLTEDDWEVDEEEPAAHEIDVDPALGQSVEDINEDVYDPDKQKYLPTLMMLSSGEVTPFNMELYFEDDTEYIIKIEGDLLGNVKVTVPGEEDEF